MDPLSWKIDIKALWRTLVSTLTRLLKIECFAAFVILVYAKQKKWRYFYWINGHKAIIGQDFQACHYFLISQNPHESFQWGVDTYWSINLLTRISFPGMKKSLGGEVGQVNRYFGALVVLWNLQLRNSKCRLSFEWRIFCNAAEATWLTKSYAVIFYFPSTQTTKNCRCFVMIEIV